MSLSDKRERLRNETHRYDLIGYSEEDVREFIREQENLVSSFMLKELTNKEFWSKWNKLAGEELK